MNPQNQPVRTVVKGSGEWVDEVFTDPVTSKVIRVTSYTLEQVKTMKDNLDKQYQSQLTNIQGMINLLTPTN